ncbi:MAG: hypothetical protein R3F05_20740, partial [Planctomycetota bacterium]
GRSLENTLDNARRPGPARTRLLAELQTCTPTRAWLILSRASFQWTDVSLQEARAIGRLARSGLLGAAARDALSKLSLPSASRRRLASELLVDPASRRAGLDLLLETGESPPIELLPILEAWRGDENDATACLAALLLYRSRGTAAAAAGAQDGIRERWSRLDATTAARLMPLLPAEDVHGWPGLRALALDSSDFGVRAAALARTGPAQSKPVLTPSLVEACLERIGSTSPGHAADLLVRLLCRSCLAPGDVARDVQERLAARIVAWQATGTLPRLVAPQLWMLSGWSPCRTTALVEATERVLESTAPVRMRALCGWLRCKADPEAWPLRPESVAALEELLLGARDAAEPLAMSDWEELAEVVADRGVLDRATWMRVLEPRLGDFAASTMMSLGGLATTDPACREAVHDLMPRLLQGDDHRLFALGLGVLAVTRWPGDGTAERLKALVPHLLPTHRAHIVPLIQSLR